MNRVTTMIAGVLLAVAAGPATAQETVPSEPLPQIGESLERGPAAHDAEADRAAIRGFLDRDDVRKAARFAGTDAGDLASRLDGLEGERLHHAADQVRALDLDDVVSLRVSTIIIILLVLIILVIAA